MMMDMFKWLAVIPLFFSCTFFFLVDRAALSLHCFRSLGLLLLSSFSITQEADIAASQDIKPDNPDQVWSHESQPSIHDCISIKRSRSSRRSRRLRNDCDEQ